MSEPIKIDGRWEREVYSHRLWVDMHRMSIPSVRYEYVVGDQFMGSVGFRADGQIFTITDCPSCGDEITKDHPHLDSAVLYIEKCTDDFAEWLSDYIQIIHPEPPVFDWEVGA